MSSSILLMASKPMSATALKIPSDFLVDKAESPRSASGLLDSAADTPVSPFKLPHQARSHSVTRGRLHAPCHAACRTTSPSTVSLNGNAGAEPTSSGHVSDTEADEVSVSSGRPSSAGAAQADEAHGRECGGVEQPRATSAIKLVAKTNLPTRKGVYQVYGFQDESKEQRRDGEIIVVAFGELNGKENVPMRVHDQCYTSEVLGSMKCDCREQLEYAMEYIRDNAAHCGLIVYLPQEGRGIGLLNKLRAYALQEQGYDTVDANLALGLPDDSREYGCVPEVLRQLGVRSTCLLTNNPRKLRCMEAVGVTVTARIPVLIAPNEHSTRYLHVKQARQGHMMDHLVDAADR